MNDPRTTRRRLLSLTGAAAAAGLASLSGCVDPDAVLTMEEVDDGSIASEVSTSVSGAEKRAVEEAVENGPATTTGVSLPVDDGAVVEVDGSYYAVEVEVTGTEAVMQYTVTVEPEPGDLGGSVDEYDDLPEVDRDKLRRLLRGRDGTIDDERFELVYTGDEVEASALVSEEGVDGVRHEGSVYSVEAGEETESEVDVYRYTAEAVAGSESEFADWARERYLWRLTGLGEGEREIVEEAIESGYYESGVEEEFRILAGRFVDRPAVDSSDWGGDYLVEYEETEYLTHIHHPPDTV